MKRECLFHSSVFEEVKSSYQPECIVCQCGADTMSGDPMGTFNMTNKGVASCLKRVLQSRLPLLILGGGNDDPFISIF